MTKTILRSLFIISVLASLTALMPTTASVAQKSETEPLALQGQEAVQRLKASGNYDSLLEAVNAARQTDGVGCTWAEQSHIFASDGAADDRFGISVAISGDTAIVGAHFDDTPGGADAGSAYVFTRSGTVWSQQQKLTPSDGAASIEFGWSVAISGDTAIVGARYGNSPGGAFTGSAYVFTRSGTVWSQQRKLTAPDGAPGDRFGWSVAISGDTAIVGAFLSLNGGSAFVFKRSGTVWSQQQKLTAPNGVASQPFGYSVAISGETAIVGRGPQSADGGSAYVFKRSGTVWSLQQRLTASDAAVGDYFGFSVAISGDTAIVGAILDDTPGGMDAGSAYVFTRSGTVWSEQQKLTASDGAAGDSFGWSGAIIGDTAIVAAYSDDRPGGFNDGSAYVFTRSSTVWSEQQKLTASDGGRATSSASRSQSAATPLLSARFLTIRREAYVHARHIYSMSSTRAAQRRRIEHRLTSTATGRRISEYFVRGRGSGGISGVRTIRYRRCSLGRGRTGSLRRILRATARRTSRFGGLRTGSGLS